MLLDGFGVASRCWILDHVRVVHGSQLSGIVLSMFLRVCLIHPFQGLHESVALVSAMVCHSGRGTRHVHLIQSGRNVAHQGH